MIPEQIPDSWINRPGFGIRKLVIFQWIVLGNILTIGYKAPLLSCLIRIQYEDTIDNISDLDTSGLSLLLAKSTTMVDYVKKDPRQEMARISQRKILYSLQYGRPPGWFNKMYAIILGPM